VLDFTNETADYEAFGRDELADEEAGSCMVRCRNIMSTTYFSKGILNDLGYHIKENPDIEVIYVNA
jgi:hypothetical protein